MYMLSGKNKKIKLEYMNDWSDTWRKRNHLDLRENKYLTLLDEQAILLGISPLSQQAIVIYFGGLFKKNNWQRIESHYPYGGKPAWQLKHPKKIMMPLDMALDRVMDIINH